MRLCDLLGVALCLALQMRQSSVFESLRAALLLSVVCRGDGEEG
jgi:hypothetical protein